MVSKDLPHVKKKYLLQVENILFSYFLILLWSQNAGLTPRMLRLPDFWAISRVVYRREIVHKIQKCVQNSIRFSFLSQVSTNQNYLTRSHVLAL